MANPQLLHFQFQVQGLDCPDCAQSLEKAVLSLPGVKQSRLNYATARLLVEAEMRDNLVASIRDLANTMGFQLQTVDEVVTPVVVSWKAWVRVRSIFIRVAAMALLIMFAFILRWVGIGIWPSRALFLGAILIGGIPLVRLVGVVLVKAHKIDMNVLMAIAVIGAVALGDFPEGAVTLLLLTIGQLFEDLAANRARKAISSLI